MANILTIIRLEKLSSKLFAIMIHHWQHAVHAHGRLAGVSLLKSKLLSLHDFKLHNVVKAGQDLLAPGSCLFDAAHVNAR